MGAAVRITPAEPESKLVVLTSAHGVSRDTAQRYLMAANDDLAATHRLLQASRVRARSLTGDHALQPLDYIYSP